MGHFQPIFNTFQARWTTFRSSQPEFKATVCVLCTVPRFGHYVSLRDISSVQEPGADGSTIPTPTPPSQNKLINIIASDIRGYAWWWCRGWGGGGSERKAYDGNRLFITVGVRLRGVSPALFSCSESQGTLILISH